MLNHTSGHALLWETILQKESYPIFRLVYLSRPVNPFTDADFDDIENKSLSANSKRDVTGILIVHDDKILQVLEGREADVRELYAKIEADKRHEITKLVCEIESDERTLLTWNMVVRKMNNIPSEITDQYLQLYTELHSATPPIPIEEEHIDLFKVISLFAPLG